MEYIKGVGRVKTQEATDFSAEGYTTYGVYVLETRALPSLTDGCKHIHRRTLYEASKMPDKLTKVNDIGGRVMTIHPHGGESSGIISMGYPGRARMFRTKGNFGGYGIGASAPRYLEACLENYARLCYTQFVKHTDFIEGESGHQEPEFLPALIPYSHIAGSSGMGVGLSTDIMPLNLMDMIDYYIDIINEVENPRIPRPDVGGVLIDMDDADWKSSVMNFRGQITTKSLIIQESDTTLVIEDSHARREDQILKKVQHYIDNDLLDYRNESKSSMRMVFDIVDLRKLSISTLKEELERATTARTTYRRIVVDKDKAVMCGFKYQAESTLKYLNKVLDRKFVRELKDLEYSIQVYRIIEYIKDSGLLPKLPTLDDDEVVSLILSSGNGYEEEHIKSALSKSIRYLTKNHDKEIRKAENEISRISNLDRKEYLISLYEEFREAVMPMYNSNPHSKVRSELLTNPKVQYKVRSNTLVVGPRGSDFDSYVVVIRQDSHVSRLSVQSDTNKEIDLSPNPGEAKVVGISSDKAKYTLVITNKDRVLAVDNSRWYNKHIMKLDDGEKVNRVWSIDEEVFDFNGKTHNIDWFIKSRVAIPIQL